jgi:SsrA-binding protein
MSNTGRKKKLDAKVAAENRKARHQYAIEDTLEAGIVLAGSEVKALREGRAQIAESYASVEGGELWLINSYIPEFSQAKARAFGHEPRRRRKLLVHPRELARLDKEVSREGMTLVPLKIYFNEKGIAKLLLGLAKGKKLADKRDTEKKRDWQREKARLLKQG